MRVFIDTNILISSILNPTSTPFKAYCKAVSYPNDGIICEQNVDELRRIFNRKFPNKIGKLEEFMSLLLNAIEIVPIPSEIIDSEESIRDINDRPILRAAISANADIFLTGDKDFLESGIKHPKILTASEFLEYWRFIFAWQHTISML